MCVHICVDTSFGLKCAGVCTGSKPYNSETMSEQTLNAFDIVYRVRNCLTTTLDSLWFVHDTIELILSYGLTTAYLLQCHQNYFCNKDINNAASYI